MAVYDINRILVPDAPPEYEDHTRDVHYVPAPCQVAWRRCRGRRLPGGDPPGSKRPVVAALRAGTRRPESRRRRGGVPARRALAPDADRPRACRAAPRPSPRLTP